MNSNTPFLTAAQLRAEDRAERQARGRAGWIKGQILRAGKIASRLWPENDTALIREHLLAGVAEWRHRHEPRWASREECAVHEAGHFIAAEAVGFCAATAKIHRGLSAYGGWGGTARSCEFPLEEGQPDWPTLTTNDVLSEAVSTLSGPVAEALLGQGDPYGSPGEFIIAGLCAAWLGQRTGMSRPAALCKLLFSTARVVHGHQGAIERIAGQLARARQVSSCQRSVEKVLRAVRAMPLDQLPSPTDEQVLDLARLIASAPIDLAKLVRRIAR